MCHTLEGNRNGATISGCTMVRGDRYNQGTETLSGLGVSLASYSCIAFLYLSVVSTRFMMVRAPMPFCGSPVAALNHSMNSVTCCVIPNASAFSFIICHVLEAYRNGDTISGCTREIRDRGSQGIETLSFLGVSSAIYGCIPCLCYSMLSASSMVVSSEMHCCDFPVVALNHFMNGVTCWVIPIASSSVCMMCHALEGDSNWDTIIRCNKQRGDRDDQGTYTLYGLRFSLDS